MAQRATEIELGLLHAALAQELLKKVKSGKASAGDLSVVRQFLKDNNIDALPEKNDDITALSTALSTLDLEEDELYH